MSDTFTCENCGETWEKGWTDEEADAEYEGAFGLGAPSGKERAVVCDDCYAEIMGWLDDAPVAQTAVIQ
jgi:hypothetical protein